MTDIDFDVLRVRLETRIETLSKQLRKLRRQLVTLKGLEELNNDLNTSSTAQL